VFTRVGKISPKPTGTTLFCSAIVFASYEEIFLATLASSPPSKLLAQVEIGLKVSPSITSLRTIQQTARPLSDNFANDGSKLSFGGGLVVDYFFGENL
jgi:hypothetical protein